MKTFSLTVIIGLAVASVQGVDGYFPIKQRAEDAGIDAFEARVYSAALENMSEPKLPNLSKDPNAVVYRLLILPNYSNPMAVRVDKQGAIYRVSARRLDGRGGYETGELVESKEFELSAEDSKTLKELLRKLNFFQLMTDDGVVMDDGDAWILEGVSQGKYHLIERMNAYTYRTKQRRLTALHDLSKFLLDRCRLSPESIRQATHLH